MASSRPTESSSDEKGQDLSLADEEKRLAKEFVSPEKIKALNDEIAVQFFSELKEFYGANYTKIYSEAKDPSVNQMNELISKILATPSKEYSSELFAECYQLFQLINSKLIKSDLDKALLAVVQPYYDIFNTCEILYVSEYMMLPYALWPQALKYPHDAMSREGGRSMYSPVWDVAYKPKADFKPTMEPIFFQMDKLVNGDPELIKVKPRVKIDEQHKMAHFWGRTGFAENSKYLLDSKDVGDSVESYMGTVTLDTSTGGKPKLVIAFRGSRGGDIEVAAFIRTLQSYKTNRAQKEKKGEDTLSPPADEKQSTLLPGSNPDWLTDLNFGSPEFIHNGILKSYMSCREGIAQSITDLGIDLSQFDGDIVVTGHSLGGGLATLCAYDLRGGFIDPPQGIPFFAHKVEPLSCGHPTKENNVRCVGFSVPAVAPFDPRAGRAFENHFKKIVTDQSPGGFVRVNISQDPIVALGRHVGEEVDPHKLLKQKEEAKKEVIRQPGENFDGTGLTGAAHEPGILWRLTRRLYKENVGEVELKPTTQEVVEEIVNTPAPMQSRLPKGVPKKLGEVFNLPENDPDLLRAPADPTMRLDKESFSAYFISRAATHLSKLDQLNHQLAEDLREKYDGILVLFNQLSPYLLKNDKENSELKNDKENSESLVQDKIKPALDAFNKSCETELDSAVDPAIRNELTFLSVLAKQALGHISVQIVEHFDKLGLSESKKAAPELKLPVEDKPTPDVKARQLQGACIRAYQMMDEKLIFSGKDLPFAAMLDKLVQKEILDSFQQTKTLDEKKNVVSYWKSVMDVCLVENNFYAARLIINFFSGNEAYKLLADLVANDRHTEQLLIEIKSFTLGTEYQKLTKLIEEKSQGNIVPSPAILKHDADKKKEHQFLAGDEQKGAGSQQHSDIARIQGMVTSARTLSLTPDTEAYIASIGFSENNLAGFLEQEKAEAEKASKLSQFSADLSYFYDQSEKKFDSILSELSKNPNALDEEQLEALKSYLTSIKEQIKEFEKNLKTSEKDKKIPKLNKVLNELNKIKQDENIRPTRSKSAQIAFAEIMTGAQSVRGIPDYTYLNQLRKQKILPQELKESWEKKLKRKGEYISLDKQDLKDFDLALPIPQNINGEVKSVQQGGKLSRAFNNAKPHSPQIKFLVNELEFKLSEIASAKHAKLPAKLNEEEKQNIMEQDALQLQNQQLELPQEIFSSDGTFTESYREFFRGTEDQVYQLLDQVAKSSIDFVWKNGKFSPEIKSFLKDKIEIVKNNSVVTMSRMDAAIDTYGEDTLKQRLIAGAYQCYGGEISPQDPEHATIMGAITRIINEQVKLFNQLHDAMAQLKAYNNPAFNEIYQEAAAISESFTTGKIRQDLSSINERIKLALQTAEEMHQVKQLPTLKAILVAQVEAGGEQQAFAIKSLFEIVTQMEPQALVAFYNTLKRQLIDGKIIFGKEINFDAITEAYLKLAIANASGNETEIAKAKAVIKNAAFQQELQFIKNNFQMSPNDPASIFAALIDAIPKDPLSQNDIFSHPIPTLDTNSPRHEDIRAHMYRDLNHYRYVAPKGASGAQEAGPLGGWYIGCYRTRDGVVHTQRFMVKRETNYAKNIIESIAGRLKGELVNSDQDYSAGTFLARQAEKAPTGENTYAVSIAFNDFRESHQLAGFEKREKMAGTKRKYFGGRARKIFDKIEELHRQKKKGLLEALIGGWWVGDNDVHTGNVGFGMDRFLAIDHAGGMMELGVKVHAGRGDIIQNALRIFRRNPEPTYHAAEYSTEIRHSQEMADTIKRCARQMSAEKIKFIIDDEIDQAVKNYRDDPEVFKQFAIRASVPEEFLKNKNIDEQAAVTKEHLYKIMHARLVNLRQYANEIELSLCFEYKKSPFYKRGEFVIKDQEKLEKFIRENPNYALGEKHHFRGESHGKSLSKGYHQTHNVVKYSSGSQLEEMFEKARLKVLGEKEMFGIRAMMVNDFNITNINDRARQYINRLELIRKILVNDNVFNNNPYKEKIDELIYFLNVYQSGTTQQHLLQLCDESYRVIQHIFKALDNNNDNNNELLAKIEIYEMFNGMNQQVAPNLLTISVEKSAFTENVQEALLELTKEIEPARTNAAHKKVLEEKLKTIEIVIAQLSSLAQSKNEELKIIPAMQMHLDALKEQLQKPTDVLKQQHFTHTRELRRADNPDFLKQGAEIFKQESKNAGENIHVVSEHKTTEPHIGSTATEETAILLDHPGANGKAGAVMIKEGDTIRIFDFENPEISFASLLTKLLLPYIKTHENLQKNGSELQSELRQFIQENYIDLLQGKQELVSETNMADLIQALVNSNKFQLKMPYTGFFKMSAEDFSSHLHQRFQTEVGKHRSDLMEWAMIWIKTLEAQGHEAKDMFLEGSSGNTEFARLFLLIVCAKGEGLSNLQSANRTGYDFHITEQDVALMREVIADNRSSPEDKASLFAGQREFNVALVQIRQHLSDPVKNNASRGELEALRAMYANDQQQLEKFKKTCEHLPLYVEASSELNKKIAIIDRELQVSKTMSPNRG